MEDEIEKYITAYLMVKIIHSNKKRKYLRTHLQPIHVLVLSSLPKK
jgi:hypothetical protein